MYWRRTGGSRLVPGKIVLSMTGIIDRDSIDFLLFDVFAVEEYCGRGRYTDHDRESLTSVLDLAQTIAENDLWPHVQKADVEEPYLKDGQVYVLPEARTSLAVLRDAGFFSAHCDYPQGGMQLPVSVNNACNGMFKGANPSTHSFMSLTRAAANLLGAHGTDEQKKNYMKPMLEGRFFGTMCLSEPDVGTSLGDLRTKARPNGDGTFSISGNKMWISGGDHDAAENIIHLVLARLPDAPAGVKGISLFVVPKFVVEHDGSLGRRNGVAVAGLNHKMGYRGISNCLLNFGESEPAIGSLVGQPHQGLSAMFHMMNEARISVGIGAAMLGSVGYRLSLSYAKERKQGRRLSDRNPASEPVTLIQHPDVRRMLMKQKVYTEGAMALCLYAGTLIDRIAVANSEQEKSGLRDLLDVLTPVVKAWPSEFGLEANKLAMQVLGGYGYSREFPLERLYRDNRLNMIHEGTNGIQALDLLGRKALMNDGRSFKALIMEIEDTVEHCRNSGELREMADTLAAQLQSSHSLVCETRERLDGGDRNSALGNASLFLNGLGHTVVGWLWLRQALVSQTLIESGDNRKQSLLGKIAACRFFFDYEMPEAATWLGNAGKPSDDLMRVTECGF